MRKWTLLEDIAQVCSILSINLQIQWIFVIVSMQMWSGVAAIVPNRPWSSQYFARGYTLPILYKECRISSEFHHQFTPGLQKFAPPLISSMSPPQSFLLPDLLASCPLKDATNPHCKEASAESRAWINSHDIFTDRKRAFFVQGSNELLCSHTYNYAGHHQLRTACDFVRLFFERESERNRADFFYL